MDLRAQGQGHCVYCGYHSDFLLVQTIADQLQNKCQSTSHLNYQENTKHEQRKHRLNDK